MSVAICYWVIVWSLVVALSNFTLVDEENIYVHVSCSAVFF